jgi:hypothetical protein
MIDLILHAHIAEGTKDLDLEKEKGIMTEVDILAEWRVGASAPS